jgi:uncharacterized protein with NRDE domain
MRASSTVMGCSNSAVMDSEWERITGTRTQVQFTRTSGQVHDLAALVLHLPLLGGVALVLEGADLRYEVHAASW